MLTFQTPTRYTVNYDNSSKTSLVQSNYARPIKKNGSIWNILIERIQNIGLYFYIFLIVTFIHI